MNQPEEGTILMFHPTAAVGHQYYRFSEAAPDNKYAMTHHHTVYEPEYLIDSSRKHIKHV